MNKPTKYRVVAFETDVKEKMRLIQYSKRSGYSIKAIMNSLLTGLLDGDLILKTETILVRKDN